MLLYWVTIRTEIEATDIRHIETIRHPDFRFHLVCHYLYVMFFFYVTISTTPQRATSLRVSHVHQGQKLVSNLSATALCVII